MAVDSRQAQGSLPRDRAGFYPEALEFFLWSWGEENESSSEHYQGRELDEAREAMATSLTKPESRRDHGRSSFLEFPA
ncbi:hypothetical protein NL676_010617 [Syzygium grande]|nr:hypothetical protein NL676_010617 [Syzygium grande]